MIANEFVEIARRRKELFESTRISSIGVLELDEKATQREVLLCDCRKMALTECRCFG